MPTENVGGIDLEVAATKYGKCFLNDGNSMQMLA